MARFPNLITHLSALLLLAACARVSARSCSKHVHCDDSDASTRDICFSWGSLCLNFDRTAQPDFLPASVRQQATPDFRIRSLKYLIGKANEVPLSLREKLLIVTAASNVMKKLNPHRFLQLNFLNVDVVQDLDNFYRRLGTFELQNQTNVQFHEAMYDIFQNMDDLHTIYRRPAPFRRSVATLGITIKDFFDSDSKGADAKPVRRYAVSDVDEDFKMNGSIPVGAEILEWNGEHIDVAVRKLGRESYASNQAAQISMGIQLLTGRFLQFQAIPEDMEVDIKYRLSDGTMKRTVLPWVFLEILENENLETLERHITQWKHYDPMSRKRPILPVSYDTARVASVANGLALEQASERVKEGNRSEIKVKEEFANLFSAEVISTSVGEIGRLVLPSFGSSPSNPLVMELKRVIRRLPNNGLIVDLRANRGGFPQYAKVVAELVTDKNFDEQPISLRATSLTAAILSEALTVFDEFGLRISEFIPALRSALKAGEPFTGPGPSLFGNLSDVREEQVYKGPVITVVDGATYSAGDLYANMQVDNNASVVVGTSDNVGAGGAGGFLYSLLATSFPTVFDMLPGGVDFTVAVARFSRSGRNAGAIVENFGLEIDVRYYPTYRDVVDDDCDLIEFLAKRLKGMSVSR